MESSMISIGNKGTIIKDIQTSSGMLYKDTKVYIREKKESYIQVSDNAGRLFWIKVSDISV